MDILSAYVDFNTGDLVYENGIVQNINEVIMEAQARIFTPAGSWWADFTFGSGLKQLFQKGTSNVTANKVITVILNSLQPMLNAQRLNGASCTVQSIIGFYVEFSVNLIDINNIVYSLPLNYKGGST